MDHEHTFAVVGVAERGASTKGLEIHVRATASEAAFHRWSTLPLLSRSLPRPVLDVPFSHMRTLPPLVMNELLETDKPFPAGQVDPLPRAAAATTSARREAFVRLSLRTDRVRQPLPRYHGWGGIINSMAAATRHTQCRQGPPGRASFRRRMRTLLI